MKGRSLTSWKMERPVRMVSLCMWKSDSSCIHKHALTGYVMHQQFNIQKLCVLPTLYLCVLYLSENKQRLVLLTA